jgi:hypothetical protein
MDSLHTAAGADPRNRYLALAASPDPGLRRLAAVQLARLERAAAPPRGEEDDAPPGELLRLIERTVGPLHRRPSGDLEGPCPWHASRSGRCLVVAGGERWWCRSCRRGGDAVVWLISFEGIGAAEARRRLGLPPRPRRRARRRPTLAIEVSAWRSSLS